MERDFWNLPHEARIRGLLEHGASEIALFCRADRNPCVAKEVIFGTGNRVFQARSKNPIIQNSAGCRVSADGANNLSSWEKLDALGKTREFFTLHLSPSQKHGDFAQGGKRTSDFKKGTLIFANCR
jgi:hypothetical protein